MSIKLYFGYVLPKFSIEELSDFSKKTKEILQPIAKAKYEKLFAKDLIEKIDDIAVNANGCDIIFEEGNKSKNLYISLWLSYIKRITDIKAKNQRDPEIDFESYVVYLPLKRKILAWFPNEHNELIKAWESIPEVKHYQYYNSTDRPKNITSKQWKKRLADWTQAFHGNLSNRVSECGLRFNFIGEDLISLPKHEDILLNIPDFETRLTRLARNEYLDKYMIAERAKLDLAGLQEGSTNYLMRFFNEGMTNIRKGLVDDELQSLKEKFEPMIIKTFDKNSLFEALKLN